MCFDLSLFSFCGNHRAFTDPISHSDVRFCIGGNADISKVLKIFNYNLRLKKINYNSSSKFRGPSRSGQKYWNGHCVKRICESFHIL